MPNKQYEKLVVDKFNKSRIKLFTALAITSVYPFDSLKFDIPFEDWAIVVKNTHDAFFDIEFIDGENELFLYKVDGTPYVISIADGKGWFEMLITKDDLRTISTHFKNMRIRITAKTVPTTGSIDMAIVGKGGE